MKELTHQNYPNHIDQDGKPIVGSEWGYIYDNRIKRIVTGLGDIKLFIKENKKDAEYDREYDRIIKNFFKDFTPHIPEPSIQDRVRAKFENDDTEVVEVVTANEKTYLVLEKSYFLLSDYLSRVDTVGFVYHNVKEDTIVRECTIIKSKDLVPVAVLLKKGGEE